MTAAERADQLVARGLDPREARAKARLVDMVTAGWRAAPPAWIFWVPGRLEVLGKHTDYAGGRTMVAALPRGFAVAVSPRADGHVRAVDAVNRQHVVVRPASARASAGGWRHYVEVTARRLARNFPGAALGADIVFASDLPRAAGMSSSSALIVSIAVALVRRAGLDGRDEWRRNIRGPLGAAGYYACIENGMSFGALDGDAGVGTHGGSEDHAAMLTAAAGRVSALAFAPLRALDTVPLPDAWTFVVAPSGVAAEKTGAVRESYNRLSAGVRRLLEIWRASEGNADSLADALATRADAVDRLRALVAQAASSDWTAAALERRLDHFLREDARIPAACEAIRAADARAMGEIADASQREAETLLGNQVPQTIALAARARADGAFAASSFGAGFGGSVWALVARDEAPAFAARWHESAFVALPGPSLQEL